VDAVDAVDAADAAGRHRHAPAGTCDAGDDPDAQHDLAQADTK